MAFPVGLDYDAVFKFKKLHTLYLLVIRLFDGPGLLGEREGLQPVLNQITD
jgi:hypothetical protein